jgi:competence protein ComEC
VENIAASRTEPWNWRLLGRLRLPVASQQNLENWLDRERDRLPLWLPVGVGSGIAVWESYWDRAALPVALMGLALLVLGLLAGRASRLRIMLIAAAVTFVLGFSLMGMKSRWVSAPVLEKVTIARIYARIEKVESLPARDVVRLTLATGGHAELPVRIRVNLDTDQYRPEFRTGAIIDVRARLMPPAGPMLPGGYDFARRAWFSGIGATGTALGDVALYRQSQDNAGLVNVRARLTAHIRDNLSLPTGGIGAALITGDTGAIDEDVAQSMRDSGMAHLLSISGLHVTAVVGATFLLVSRILSLFPAIALRVAIPILAAAAGALAAIGYTLLSGAEVPTVRSCVASLLILAALAAGREALSLRLVAFGALFVLCLWPESMAGPSFQLSFAAVTTIVVLHESPWARQYFSAPERGVIVRLGLALLSLLATGIAIELALAPITLAHFNRSGLYGALANIVAIPLTTFIIMPAEGLALLFDSVGLGAPFWWVAGQGIALLIGLSQMVSALPGAVSTLPNMPNWAFGFMIIGGLWCAIFQTRMRLLGLLPFVIGMVFMLAAPRPDVMITGDGKHLAMVGDGGQIALLRSRAGDYVKDALGETAGINAEPLDMEQWPGSNCNLDACIIQIKRAGRNWTILATRARYAIPTMELAAACRRVDIVVSDRWLPNSCQPKWLKLDRDFLAETGGLAIDLSAPLVTTVAQSTNGSPWVDAAKTADAKARSEPFQRNGLKAKAVP